MAKNALRAIGTARLHHKCTRLASTHVVSQRPDARQLRRAKLRWRIACSVLSRRRCLWSSCAVVERQHVFKLQEWTFRATLTFIWRARGTFMLKLLCTVHCGVIIKRRGQTILPSMKLLWHWLRAMPRPCSHLHGRCARWYSLGLHVADESASSRSRKGASAALISKGRRRWRWMHESVAHAIVQPWWEHWGWRNLLR